jgi:hypothetical protein
MWKYVSQFIVLSVIILFCMVKSNANGIFSLSDLKQSSSGSANIVCNTTIQSGMMLMDEDCLKYDLYPQIDFEESVNLVWDKIVAIHNPYDTVQDDFISTGSSVVFSWIIPLSDYKNLNLNSSFVSWYNKIIWKKIAIPLETLAMQQVQGYGIIAADRDISDYGDCATQNFMVGLEATKHILIKPGQLRNANHTFTDLDGYCKGEGEEYMFYQWICGVSSMAFRASILDPEITITKRSSHAKRYVQYYGEKVVGDDASMYEDIKEFEIQNNSSTPLLIKSKIIWDTPYLVYIHQTPLSSPVSVFKKETGPLSAVLERTIVKAGEVVKTSWPSEYYEKTYEGN